MVEINIGVWDSPRRLRDRIIELAKLIMSITAVNGFYVISKRSWIMLIVNLVPFITTMLILISHSKWKKSPPNPFPPNGAKALTEKELKVKEDKDEQN